jgi:hypothetical protein
MGGSLGSFEELSDAFGWMIEAEYTLSSHFLAVLSGDSWLRGTIS